MGPLRGGRPSCANHTCPVGELFYTLWPLFHLRFKHSEMILGPCQQTSPFGFKLSAQKAAFRRTEDKETWME